MFGTQSTVIHDEWTINWEFERKDNEGANIENHILFNCRTAVPGVHNIKGTKVEETKFIHGQRSKSVTFRYIPI